MKGPFTFWTFFGLTIWIDLITAALFLVIGKKHVAKRSSNKRVSVLIPVYKETVSDLINTIDSIYKDKYPLEKVIVCSDPDSSYLKDAVRRLSKDYPDLVYIECPHRSKAKKINYTVKRIGNNFDGFLYVRDCKVVSSDKCIRKMLAQFDSDDVAAVTSHGYLTSPKNFLARSYHHGKEWINELGKFRKTAQQMRSAIFVVCGASTIYRMSILREIPIPHSTKTEDTHYTWVLQIMGYKIRVANKAKVCAPDVDGKWFSGIRNQLKQSYRWSSGTIQCIYTEGKRLNKNKKLLYTTILPGFIEAITYSIALIILPFLMYYYPVFAVGFIIGDTVFSLLGTLIFIPKRIFSIIFHYPQIFFYKYLNAWVFLSAFIIVTLQKASGRSSKWSNEWVPLSSSIQESPRKLLKVKAR